MDKTPYIRVTRRPGERRFLLQWVTAFCVLSFAGQAVASDGRQQKQKNILFIMADDMGTDALRLYTPEIRLDSDPTNSNWVAPTPTIDSLASFGLTFNRAYAQPICSPTRATIITGKYGFRTGVRWPVGRGQDIDIFDTELLPKVLKDKGYATAMVGKYHLSNAESPPLDVELVKDEPITAGFDYFAGVLEGALAYFNWPQTINGSAIEGETQTSNEFATTENVNQAKGWISQQELAGKPWFMSLNFAAPHWPYTTPPANLVDPQVRSQVENAVRAAGVDENGVDWSNWDYTENHTPLFPNPVFVPGVFDPDAVILPQSLEVNRAIFNALISAMDMALGDLLESIDPSNTCVIFLGDNGTSGAGNFNSVVPPFDSTKAKATLYEGGIRVPMVVYDPSIKKPGRYTDAMVNTVDIYAMILKWAGCANPNRFDGRHFESVLHSHGSKANTRKFVYADMETPPFGDAFVSETIQNERYKLIVNTGEEEFYDLRRDPTESDNLLAGGEMDPREKRNYKLLVKWLEKLTTSTLEDEEGD